MRECGECNSPPTRLHNHVPVINDITFSPASARGMALDAWGVRPRAAYIPSIRMEKKIVYQNNTRRYNGQQSVILIR
jgi:hypothetical protein